MRARRAEPAARVRRRDAGPRADLRGRAALALEVALAATLVVSASLYVARVGARATAQWMDRRALAASETIPAQDGVRPEGERPVPTAVARAERPEGTLFGSIAIPRLGVASSIREGVSDGTLDVAVGRIPGTSDSTARGNIGLAAHRDTIFRPLRNIRTGDSVRLDTPAGSAEYVVTDTSVVDPEDVHVLDHTTRPAVTLVTCYPFSYIGHAPQRFVVRAERR